MELLNSIIGFFHALFQNADKLVLELSLHQEQVQWFHDSLFLFFMLMAIVSLVCLSSTYRTRFFIATILCIQSVAFLAIY
jgi:hypothetical protein